MKISIDHSVMATYVKLREPNGQVKTRIWEGYYLDYDESDELVGIEYLAVPEIKHHDKFAHYIRKIIGWFK